MSDSLHEKQLAHEVKTSSTFPLSLPASPSRVPQSDLFPRSPFPPILFFSLNISSVMASSEADIYPASPSLCTVAARNVEHSSL